MSTPPRTPEALVDRLLYGTEEEQVAAAEALEQLGALAGATLCAALQDAQSNTRALRLQLDRLASDRAEADATLRQAARLRGEISRSEERVCRLARVLHHIRDREALRPLFEALRRSQSRESHALAQALLAQGKPATPLLAQALNHDSPWVAISAAEALTTLGGPEVGGLLVHRLENAVQDLLRISLIRCLGRLGDPVAVEALSRLVVAGTRDERLFAVEALGRLGDPRGLEAVLRCAAADGAYSADVALEAASLRALGGIAHPRGIRLLVETLRGTRPQLYEPAVAALTQIAERQPVLELRLALPSLRHRIRRPCGEPESLVLACKSLIEQIETHTASVKSLPLPAVAVSCDPQQLPRPVESATFPADALPIPDPAPEPVPPPDGSRRGLAEWARRWRKR